jgi:cytochrome c-type protein NapB
MRREDHEGLTRGGSDMKRNLILTMAILWATAACGPATTASSDLQAETPIEAPPSPAGVPDSDLGLSKTSVFDTPEPVVVNAESSDPGDKPTVPRATADMAPRIPHRVSDLGPITLAKNPCMGCHDGSGGTEIPDSHKTNLRLAPGKIGDKLVGARTVCISCHVAQTDAKPLVENTH